MSALAQAWVVSSKTPIDVDGWNSKCRIYACEMESTRAHRLKSTLSYRRYSSQWHQPAHGDAFLLFNRPEEHVHVLFLNPPYDTDRQHKRLEERWLRRFAPLVVVGGVLLHFVPFYALGASAETIARHFDRVVCFRVPAPHFDAFKQVVLVGRKRMPLATPDPAIVAQVRAWSADAASIPELPAHGHACPSFVISTSLPARAPTWEMRETDLTETLASYAPWTFTDRGGRRQATPNVEPEGPYTEIMVPRLRLACPPRPAHIAMAAGAGVLSGARLTPDAGQRGPELLLKGVHRRTYRHLRWKENAKHEHVAEERQHHPELQLSILDLSTGRYHTLTPTIEPTEHASPSQWSVGDLLARYSGSMLRAMRERCDLLYDPTRPGDKARVLPDISPTPLVGGQEDGVRALLRLLNEPDRTAILLGEIGVGKTRMSLTAAYHHLGGRGRVFVICPTALIAEWQSEVEKVLPGRRVVVLENVSDVDALAARPCDGFEVVLMSKEQAKLGHEWQGVTTCPRCGTRQKESGSKLAETRAFCEHAITAPSNAAAHILARLLPLASVMSDPQLTGAVEHVGGRIARRMKVREGADWHRLDYVVRAIVPAVRRNVARTQGHNYETARGWRTILESLLHALGDDALIVETALALFRSSLTDRDTNAEYGGPHMVRTMAAELLLLLPPSSPFIGSTLREMERYMGRDYRGNVGRLFNRRRSIEIANDVRRSGRWTKETAQREPLGGYGCIGDVPLYLSEERGSEKSLRYAIERLAAFAVWSEETCGELLIQAIPEPTRRVQLARYLLRRHPKLFDLMILEECFVAGTLVSGRPIETIRVGDMVDSFDERTGQCVKRRVSRLWIRRTDLLVRVTFANGASFVCTPNHPILTSDGWIPAGRLTHEHDVFTMRCGSESMDRHVFHVRNTNHEGGRPRGGTVQERSRVLQQQLCGQGSFPEEPDVALGRSVPRLWCDGASGRKGRNSLSPTWVRLLLASVFGEVSATIPTYGEGVSVSLVQEGVAPCALQSRTRSSKWVRLLRPIVQGQVASKTPLQVQDGAVGTIGVFEAHEVEQPHARSERSCADECQSTRADVLGAGWEWSTDRATETARGSSGLADGGSGAHRASRGAVPVLATPLQDRHRVGNAQARCGSRREFAQDPKVEVLGQAKDGRLERTRVASVEVLERGSDGGFGPVCSDGLVYNLEVEETHTYFAEGVVVHNCHMFAHGESAQSKAAQRLLSLCMRRRLPVIALTGSVMNGFARSLFVLLWHLSSAFRAEFDFGDAGEFERRYGFLVQVVEQYNEKKERVVFGSHSDRVTTRERTTGAAPGVLPTVVLRFLLGMGVTVQLSDLEVALPPCHERIVYVDPTVEQTDNAHRLLAKVLGAMAADRFKAGLAGKLFGALGHLPRYYDHATNDTGNREDGSWTVGYPIGTEGVASPTLLCVPGLDPATRLPKESALVHEVRKALDDGRNVVVATTRIDLGERLTRVLGEDLADIGVRPVFLNAKKVSAKKRRDWVISAKEAGARVLVCNPAALPQGLNVLVGHFSVVCMFDDPDNNPTLLRQFRGRFVRIGQTSDVHLLLFVYRGTLQEDANDHLQKKRVVAEAADGLDPSAAFIVAGVGEQASFESDLGKALYAKLTG